MAQELAGKVAIITGAASGIGRAMAELFVAEGAKVVIGDINEAEGAAFARALGANAAFQKADVSKREDVKALVDFGVSRFGALNIMCNNAGLPGPPSPRFLGDSLDAYERIIAVNYLGTVWGTHAAAHHMAKHGGGAILNTASIAGITPGFGYIGYRASKAAVVNFTKSAAIDLGEFGIRVNALAPGSIKTPIMDYREPGLSEPEVLRVRAEIDRVMTSYQVLKTHGQPIDVAQAALFLVSDRARQITGILMPIDSGITAGDPANHAADVNAAIQAELANIKAERG
jgi:NAD(P)-dependent dehydrogenase (short-subunit alcohol dehydrogenase family)